MPEINVPVSKDRIAADIVIAAVSSGKLLNPNNGVAQTPEDLAAAFKTIRQALEE